MDKHKAMLFSFNTFRKILNENIFYMDIFPFIPFNDKNNGYRFIFKANASTGYGHINGKGKIFSSAKIRCNFILINKSTLKNDIIHYSMQGCSSRFKKSYNVTSP